MDPSSQLAARFIRELAELADRLAGRDITVSSLHAGYSHFGCWHLIASKHMDAVKFFWDGRDGHITVESSPIRKNSDPNEWKNEAAKGFTKVGGDNPINFVEEYLTKRFPE